MSILPDSTSTNDEIRAWVRAALAALDDTPRRKNWRYRAVGMTYGEAIAVAPRDTRLHIQVPVGEMRLLRDVASRRGIGVETLIRRAVGTWLVCAEDLEPDDLPYFTRGGLIGPG